MQFETITPETPGEEMGILSLNRPKACNAVDEKMVEELERFWNDRLLASDIGAVTNGERLCAAQPPSMPAWAGPILACSYSLPRMIGAGCAYEFMYTGDSISAHEALFLGLVRRIVEKADLHDTAAAHAKRLATKSPMGLRLTTEAINTNIDARGLEKALQIEDRNQTLLSLGVLPGR